MKSFIGNIEAKLDSKGRTFVPASYRKLLVNGSDKMFIVMRKDPTHDCLIMYPQEVWEQKLNAFKANLNEWNPADELLLMQFVSEADVLELDGQGRVLLQKRFLDMIGAETEVLFVGAIDKFSVWSKSGYEKTKLAAADFARQMTKRMMQKPN